MHRPWISLDFQSPTCLTFLVLLKAQELSRYQGAVLDQYPRIFANGIFMCGKNITKHYQKIYQRLPFSSSIIWRMIRLGSFGLKTANSLRFRLALGTPSSTTTSVQPRYRASPLPSRRLGKLRSDLIANFFSNPSDSAS